MAGIRIRILAYGSGDGEYERVMVVNTSCYSKALSVGVKIARKAWRDMGSEHTADGRLYSVTIIPSGEL